MEFIRNLFATANIDNLGKLAWFIDQSESIHPVICIKKYGGFEWEKMVTLSGANWRQYRDAISSSTTEMFAELTRDAYEPQTNDMLISLIKTLTPKQRTEWLQVNPEYKKNFCTDCGEFDSDIKKCIHHDCPGMCEKCFDKKNKEGFETCGCCNKKQELTCPICQDEHSAENMVKSETCCHHVCWKCFGMSVKSSRPLATCPMCREVFCENLTVDEYSDDEMQELEEDDEIPELDDEYTIPLNVDDSVWIQEALLQFAQQEAQIANNQVGLSV
jgi:hypothetical protein